MSPVASAPPGCVLVGIGNTRWALTTRWATERGQVLHFAVADDTGFTAAVSRAWNALPPGRDRSVAVCSVNPPALAGFKSWCRESGIAPVRVVGEDLAPPIDADVLEPAKVGADRLCVAAAAFELVGGACVAADFGTAVTIDLVSDNGVLLGGTILPGMDMSARALHGQTALLPLVEVGRASEIPGKDTAGAIRGGIFAMMCGALREIVERYATDIGKWPPLVVTGGDGPAVAQACDFVDHLVPDLLFDGLWLACRRAACGHAND